MEAQLRMSNVQLIKVLGGLTENTREEIIKELREENFPEVKKELNLQFKTAHKVASGRIMELMSLLTSLNSHNSEGLPTS